MPPLEDLGRRLAPLALGLAALAAACSSNAAQQAEPPAALPTLTPAPSTPLPPAERYQRVACRLDPPRGWTVECGYLTVPENRAKPASNLITLAVAVVKADSARPLKDPIVYLDGGPGGSVLEVASRIFDGWFGPFAIDRDIVLFDQRGAGKSQPALDCHEFNNAFRRSVEEDIRGEALQQLVVDALAGCHDALVARGVDLSGYTSAESATDLAELREALGYEEWNLYGISYGTRLALTAMRDHPEGIRSVILDSAYPPQADLYAALLPNAGRAFDALFAGCAADPVCGSAHPGIESTFYELVARLNESPAGLEVENYGRGETIHAKMSGDVLVQSLFGALYSTSTIPWLPAVIAEAHGGASLDVLTPLLGDLFFTFDTLSIGMHYSVQCAEELPFGSQQAIEASAGANPNVRALLDLEPITRICEVWDVPAADPRENEPVVSDIPTLVLAGEYDPITPPDWGRQVADSLSRAYYFAFPGVGHGASVVDYCPLDIMLAFLADPAVAPDGSCIASMPWPYFETTPF
jgi:pimeloyl-ACP methyl ester carboxylesterase